MPFVPVPATLQANIRFDLDGQQIENVMCFSWIGGTFEAACDVVYGVLDLTWWATLRASISNQCVHNEVYLVDLSSESGGVQTRPAFENPAGAANVEPVPNNVAFCITHRTANRGRSYRGRTYIAGLSNEVVSVNTVQQVNVTNIELAFNAMREDMADANVAFVVASRYHNNAPRVAGLRTPVTLSLALDRTVDSQRKRLPGRGR